MQVEKPQNEGACITRGAWTIHTRCWASAYGNWGLVFNLACTRTRIIPELHIDYAELNYGILYIVLDLNEHEHYTGKVMLMMLLTIKQMRYHLRTGTTKQACYVEMT